MRPVRQWAFRTVAAVAAAGALVGAGCGGGSDNDSTSQSPADRLNVSLTATAASATAIDLRWSVSGGAPTRYEISINGTFYASAYPSSASSTSEGVRISSLTPGTNYCFVVTEICFPFGACGRSNEACARTPAP
jgi:hypothetical protein